MDSAELLQEVDIPCQNVSLEMDDATGEHTVHKVGVGTVWDLLGQLNAGVPRIKHLVTNKANQWLALSPLNCHKLPP